MEVEAVLCMNGGDGDASYAANSIVTRRVLSATQPALEKTIGSLLRSMSASRSSLAMADLGCSSGPNTLSVVTTVAGVLKRRRHPELQVFLNDLPHNDFNSIFRSVPSLLQRLRAGEGDGGFSCYLSAAPGSFYGRLFPNQSLHLVHSSYGAGHWLSKVPPGLHDADGTPLNKGNIYISKSSPPCVWKAYLEQFRRDMASFLRHRSEEMVPGGRMVLILQSREGTDPTSREATSPWGILGTALSALVSEGAVRKERLDSFDIPCYNPSIDEVQDVLSNQDFFAVEGIETFTIEVGRTRAEAEQLVKGARSVSEPMVAYHFGGESMDKLYEIHARLFEADLKNEASKIVSALVLLENMKKETS